MRELELEEIRSYLPKGTRTTVSQELVDRVNDIAKDEDIAAHYRNNFVDHISIMKTGKYTMDEYANAVRFVSYQLRGDNKNDSWRKTFPDRYKKLHLSGATPEKIGAHVASFTKSKLVVQITEQSLIPAHVSNAALFQRAINTQAELMTTAHSEKVRSDAAANLIMHLKPPEAQKVKLEITTTTTDEISDLRQVTAQLAQVQLRMIQSGATAESIAHSSIIHDAEVVEND